MDKLVEHLRGALEPAAPLATARFRVAFSGGVDSTALLFCLSRLREETHCQVGAIHVDHALNPESASWARHCLAVASRLGVDCLIRTVVVPAGGRRGPEAAARQARYQALRDVLGPGEWLLTGHQAEDQLETVLLHLARGSGLAGLAGIPRRTRFGTGWLLRPWLDQPRRVLAECVAAAGLPWLDDPLNADLRLDRNYLRRQVVPVLEDRWPAIARAAGRSAALAAEAAALLADVAAADATGVVREARLELPAFRALGSVRQRNLIRHLAAKRGWAVPPEARLRVGLAQLLSAGTDRAPVVRWPGGEIRRYRNHLYLLDEGAVGLPVDTGPWEWDPATRLDLGSPRGVLQLERASAGLAAEAVAGRLLVGLRDTPAVSHLPGARATLKRVFQGHGVVPWMRPHVPLVWCDDRLLAVGSLWYSRAAMAGPGEPAWQLGWEGHGALH